MLKCTDFYALDKYWRIKDINASMVYKIAIAKKFRQPYTQKLWERVCDINMNTLQWMEVYKVNACDVKYKKFAEFKFKILHDILPSRVKISKWQKEIPPNCEYCNETENTAHMLFYCKRVSDIWKCLNAVLQVDIKIKHIIFGFNCNYNTGAIRHLCIVIVSCAIFATWCKCSLEKSNYAHVNLKSEIKQQLCFYLNVFKYILAGKQKNHFIHIVKNIISQL